MIVNEGICKHGWDSCGLDLMLRRNLKSFSGLLLFGFIAAVMTWSSLHRPAPGQEEYGVESPNPSAENTGLEFASERGAGISAESSAVAVEVAGYPPPLAATTPTYESRSADEVWAAFVESLIVHHFGISGMALINYDYDCSATTCRVLLVPATSKMEPSELAPRWGEIRTIASEIVANSNGALQSVSIRARTDPSRREQDVEVLFNRHGENSTLTIDIPSQTAIPRACSWLPAQAAVECLAREGRALQDDAEAQVIVIE